jgi:hypothetical protein
MYHNFFCKKIFNIENMRKKQIFLLTIVSVLLNLGVVSCDFKYDPYNDHEYVDLGLPSGLKWATCNVGASYPEDLGDYYAWGETSTKNSYVRTTYKWRKFSDGEMTKYSIDLDDKRILDDADDIVSVKMGGRWRLPTRTEQDELRDFCKWEWIGGGYKVIGPNGNFIFLPAAGAVDGSDRHDVGVCGHYWSSSLYPMDSESSYYLGFNPEKVACFHSNRFVGRSVRGVCK